MAALMRCVGAHVPYDSMVCIFGCCEDKDIPAMLEKVALGGDKIIFTKARSNPRAADPDELQREFAEQSGKMSQVAKSLPEALDLASRAVGPVPCRRGLQRASFFAPSELTGCPSWYLGHEKTPSPHARFPHSGWTVSGSIRWPPGLVQAEGPRPRTSRTMLHSPSQTPLSCSATGPLPFYPAACPA